MRSLLGRALFRQWWNTYDNLGAWALLGVTACVCGLPLVTAPAVCGALLYCAARADREAEIGLDSFREGFRHFGWRSTRMGLLALLTAILLLVNVRFYLGWQALRPPLLRFALAGLAAWLGLYALMIIHIGWAFMALQDIPLRKALRRGLLITLGHPVACLFAAGWGAVLFGLLLATGFGVVALGGAALANLAMGLAAGGLEYYEEREDQLLRARLTAEGAKTWTELRALEEREAARQRRYNRSWRRLMQPWNMDQ